MKNPKISVVITTYNQEKYLEQAINSVLNQTLTPYEIIVVDDGSIDNTKELIKKYEKKIKYFYKKNGGNASAKNYGVEKSKGSFIAFLDADDVWLPKKLELQYRAMQKNSHVGIVYSPFTLIDLNGKILMKKNQLPEINKPYPRILLGNFVGLSGTLVRKKCFYTCGLLDEKTRTHEDWDLWMRFAKKYSFLLCDEIVYLYRASKPNKFKKKNINLRLKDFMRIIKKAFKNDPDLSFLFKLRCISNWYFDLAKTCFFRKQLARTIELSLLSVLYMPFQLKIYFFYPFSILRKAFNKFL